MTNERNDSHLESDAARCASPRRDRSNILRYLATMAIWGICFTAGSQILKRELLPSGPISWLVALIPAVAAIFVLRAYYRFWSQTDELQRKVQLQALAIGFGGTFFAVSCYRMFERIGAPTADLGDFVFVMAIIYSVAGVLGWRRYL